MKRFNLRMATNKANELREEKISDSEIARILGVERQNIYSHMIEKKQSSIPKIHLYAEVFGFSYNEFFSMGFDESGGGID